MVGILVSNAWQYFEKCGTGNQLVSHDGIGYRYNADGHLIEKGALQADGSLVQGNGIDHWHYRYDSRERLVEVDKNGQLLARYTYNPLGQRSSKYLPQQGRTLYFLYSEEGLVAEYDAQGSLVQEYCYDPTSTWMTQPLFTRARRADNGQWSLSYFVTSHLGVPQMAFEKSGEMTWQANIQAFGQVEINAGIISVNLRFPGQYLDGETGLYQNFFRDYDPRTGRYVQSDPIGLRAGLNTYVYVEGKPTSRIDFLGLFSFPGMGGMSASQIMSYGEAQAVMSSPQVQADQAKSEVTWESYYAPDYLTVETSLYIFTCSITYTRFGDAFCGCGFERGYPRLGVGANLSAGFVVKPVLPSQSQLNEHLNGYSASAGYYYLVGGGAAVSPAGAAVNVGVGVGGAAVVPGAASWKMGDN